MSINIEKFREIVIKSSAEFEKQFMPINPPPTNAKAAKVLEVLKKRQEKLGIDHADILAEIASAILGADIELPKHRNIEMIPFAAVVPLNADNGHNYPVGKPCILKSGSRGIRYRPAEGWSAGNELSRNTKDIRPATLDETAKAFEKIHESEIDALFSEYKIFFV